MSLINDALKKAQKQRTQDGPPLAAMPGIGGESATRIARREKPAGSNALLLWAGIGAAALVILLVGGFFLVRSMTGSPTATAPVAAVPAATPTIAATAPAAPTPAASAPVPAAAPTTTFVIPSTPVVETAPAVVAPAPAPVAVAAAPAPAPVAEVPKVVAPPAKMATKGVAYIESLRVAGIRASTTDSKVLMNDRVYRIGDMVEPHLGLRLSGITASSLTFEDEEGARYTRNFN